MSVLSAPFAPYGVADHRRPQQLGVKVGNPLERSPAAFSHLLPAAELTVRMRRLLAPIVGRKQLDECLNVMCIQSSVHLLEHEQPLAFNPSSHPPDPASSISG